MSQGDKVLERTTLRDRAESSLRDFIVRGDLGSGARINEVALARELGISRGPLREAIQVLAREGLLEIIRHRGAFVRSVDAQGLRDLYELRIALETHAVRMLARTDAGGAAVALRQVLDGAEAALAGDQDGYPNDLDFHRRLFRLMDNDVLSSAADDVQAQISLARARSARNPERARDALAEHRAIVDALADADVGRAAELLEVHLRMSYDSAVAALGAENQVAGD